MGFESARPVCAGVLVDRVVHLVVVRKVARAARKAVHMNVGHRLPSLLTVLHSNYSVTPVSTERGMPALLCLSEPTQHSHAL